MNREMSNGHEPVPSGESETRIDNAMTFTINYLNDRIARYEGYVNDEKRYKSFRNDAKKEVHLCQKRLEKIAQGDTDAAVKFLQSMEVTVNMKINGLADVRNIAMEDEPGDKKYIDEKKDKIEMYAKELAGIQKSIVALGGKTIE